jgi:hypothetical protein
MLTISWVPLGIQRIYALITTNVIKSKVRTTAEALSDELTSAIARFDNSLSFYIYLFAGGVLFRHTLLQLFRRVFRRGTVAPIGNTVGTLGETGIRSGLAALKMQPIQAGRSGNATGPVRSGASIPDQFQV